MDETAARARLIAEFGHLLDHPLILSIANDFDLSIPKQEAEARQILGSIAFSANDEEASTTVFGGGDAIDEGLSSTSGNSISKSFQLPQAPAPAAYLVGLKPFEDAQAVASIPDDEKEAMLRQMFSNLKPLDITLAFRKHRGDFDASLEELLKIEYLESIGERQKGIDAFVVEENYDRSPNSPRNGKKAQWNKKRNVKWRNMAPSGGNGDNNSSWPPYQSLDRTNPSPGSSETDAASIHSYNTPTRELSRKQEEEVRYLSSCINLAESEVSKVYVACDSSLAETVDRLVEAFYRIGYAENHASLEGRTTTLSRKYPMVPRAYLPCISQMTENMADAEEVARILQQLYSKPGRTSIVVDYSLAPVLIESYNAQPVHKNAAANTTFNKPTQPTLALQPLVSSSNPSPGMQSNSGQGKSRLNSNSWTTVTRQKKSNGNKPLPKGWSGNTSNSPAVQAPLADNLGYSRRAANSAAMHAFRKGSSNPLWKQAAVVYHERGTVLGRQVMSAEADQVVSHSRTSSSIDLHGVFVADGVRIALQEVQAWWRVLDHDPRVEQLGKYGLARESGGFHIVTGRGIHSEGGKSRLRPAVLRALVNDGWNVRVDTGALVVNGKR